MKTYIISLFCVLLGSTAHADQKEYTYTTQNGYGAWTEGATNPSDSSFNRGRYDNISFTLNPDSFGAPTPQGGGASLTTGTLTDGSAATPEDLLGMDNYFQSENLVYLTQITIKGESRNLTSFQANTYLRITLDTGEVYTSSAVVQSITPTRDPWQNSWFHTDDVGVFTFSEDIVLKIGVEYSAQFVDASGNLLTGNNRPYLDFTSAGDDGFSAGGSATWSPAGMVVETKSIIPEPSVGALSLLALAGLVARRRRKA